MELSTISENKHQELLSRLNPLMDFLTKNGYSYFVVAGKEGTCSRYIGGKRDDVAGMISGIAESQKQIADMFIDIVKDVKSKKK